MWVLSMWPSQGKQMGGRREKAEVRGLLHLFREEEINLREEKKWGQEGSSKAVSVRSMAISAHLCAPSSSEVPVDPSATSCHFCCLAEFPGH